MASILSVLVCVPLARAIDGLQRPGSKHTVPNSPGAPLPSNVLRAGTARGPHGTNLAWTRSHLINTVRENCLLSPALSSTGSTGGEGEKRGPLAHAIDGPQRPRSKHTIPKSPRAPLLSNVLRAGTARGPCGTNLVWAIVLLLLSATLTHAIDGPLRPEESLKYLKTEPGLKIELVAAEPMVIDPVAVAWDEKGRMFVVEDRGYPIGPGPGKAPVGQVVMLESSRGDGRYDKRTVYAEGLTFPNGVMPWKGGIYVTCAPYLYYFKDTKGDGRADVKEIVFKGFQDLSTTQLRVSHPTLNLDNWVYLTSGLTAARVSSPAHPERPPVFLNRLDGRFRPGTDELEPNAGTAQFGQTFDRFGRKFICSNRNHIQEVVLQLAYLKRNPNLVFSEMVEDIPDHEAACRVYPLSANITTAAAHTGYITSACGIMIFDGTALPDDYRGNSFTCEPAGNLVHRDVLSRNGVTDIARRAYPTNEFLASPDNWFRPVNLATGPDGALYVCDMYRKTIEHPEYLPEATRKVTDFESGKTMGRIYRISAMRSGKERQTSDLSQLSAKELVEKFNDANSWQRLTAQRLLLERRPPEAVDALKKLSRNGTVPEARIHALRTLEGLGGLTETEILAALEDKEPAVREHGIQLAEPRLANSPALLSRVLALADDADARVRFQCALTLGELKGQEIIPALEKVLERNLNDKWTRTAVLTSITHRESQFLRQWLQQPRNHSSPENAGMSALMGELGHILAAASLADKLPGELEEILRSDNPVDLSWQMAAVAGFGAGLRGRDHRTPEPSGLMLVCKGGAADLCGRLDTLFRRSGGMAADKNRALDARLAAISLLGQAEYQTSGKTLELLIDPAQPSEVQAAAIRSLGRMSDPAIGPALVTRQRWQSYSPSLRDAALSALTASTNRLHALFAAIEAGDVPAWTVNADRRNALMKHKDEAVRDRATALFKDLQPGDRMKIYEENKSVLALKPNAKNGHAVFQKTCTPCHVFAGEGHTVGPDLTGIRNQPSDVLLLHIIVPEYEIMPIYTCYNVELKDGQAYTGLLAAETPSAITLRMAQGLEQQIPRAQISSMNTSRLSLMPQELEKTMTKQDLADLIGFLKGLGE